MNYEEKAKAYDAAFKKAENIHRFSSDPAEIKRMEEIFPELKGSDEEKIRKWLIRTLKALNTSGIDIDGAYEFMIPAIAWLEKQKSEDKVEAITDGLETEFQKQVSCLIASAANREHGYTHGYVKWAAQSLLNYAKNEQKPIKEQNVCDTCEEQASCVTPCPMKLIEEQKPVEWSEEDKNLFEWTYINLTELKDRFGEGHGKVGECLSWLKSLHPQSRGEDQLKLLRQSCVEHWEQRICMVKFETIKRLADNMYYAAQSMTTDASKLHKAMEEYHQFVINSAGDGE